MPKRLSHWGGHNIPGMDVAVAGRGRTDLLLLMSTKSSWYKQTQGPLTVILSRSSPNRVLRELFLCDRAFPGALNLFLNEPRNKSEIQECDIYLESLYIYILQRNCPRLHCRRELEPAQVVSSQLPALSHRHASFSGRRLAPRQLGRWWHRPDADAKKKCRASDQMHKTLIGPPIQADAKLEISKLQIPKFGVGWKKKEFAKCQSKRTLQPRNNGGHCRESSVKERIHKMCFQYVKDLNTGSVNWSQFVLLKMFVLFQTCLRFWFWNPKLGTFFSTFLGCQRSPKMAADFHGQLSTGLSEGSSSSWWKQTILKSWTKIPRWMLVVQTEIT